MDEHVTGEPAVTPEGVPPVAQTGAVTPEVLDSGAVPTWSVLPDQADGTAAAPSGRSGRRALVAGVTAAAVLVTAGGAYAAWSRLNGNGPQPAEVLPASTVAFAEVDLDPSVGQKLALYNLLKKFPDTSGLQATDKNFGDWLVRRLSEGGSSGDGLDFAKDVQPWLGKRFALAAVPAPAGSGAGGSSVDGVVVVQETDEKAAAAAMTKLRAHGSEHLGYAFLDGFLVVTPDSAQGAARVVSGAQKAPLSAAGTFTADVDSLGSDQVVTAWVDAAKAGSLVKDQLAAVPGADSAQLDSVLGQSWQGRWVLGVHAADDSVEMRVRTFGSGSSGSTPAPVRIRHVAPGAFAVVAFSGAGKALADSWSKVSSAPAYADLAGQASALGLTLPGDIEALLGDQLTISVGGDPTQEPSVLAAATSQHPGAGKAVLDRLLALAGPDAANGIGLSTQVDGDTLYVGSSADVVAAGHGGAAAAQVTDSDLFKAAVADPSRAQVVVYLDLVKLWSTLKASGTELPSPELKNLKAVGISAVTSGGGSDLTVRVVVG